MPAKTTPLSKYHPVRYEGAFFELINACFDQFNMHSIEDRDKYRGLLLGTIFETEVKELLKEHPEELPVGMSQGLWTQYKEELFSAHIDYLLGGENIFHLQEELIEMFRHTDVSEIKLADLRAPYDSFYLHFGDLTSQRIDPDRYIDGGYLELTGEAESLLVTLTTRNSSIDIQDARINEMKALNLESHLYLSLSLESGQTVARSMAEATGDEWWENYNKAQFEMWRPHLSEVSNIIVNALCFLTSEHNDAVLRFPPETPRGFIGKYERADTPKQRERTLSKAKSSGFRRVVFIGDTYQRSMAYDTGTRCLSAPHWRRGHWRNQAWGPHRADRKLLWIKPTLVNRESPDSPVRHIYDVAPKPD